MGRKKKKKNKRKTKKQEALSGTPGILQHPLTQTLTKGGLLVLTAIASGGVGAALGKHSLLAGVPLALYGVHKQNHYLVAAGLGLTMSNGFQRAKKAPRQEGVNGFDLKQLSTDAKERVGTYFKNFSEKLYLNPKGTSSELSGDEKEEVTYFLNPYKGANELDMTAIDRIQEQIASMNSNTSGNGMNALDEIDREF